MKVVFVLMALLTLIQIASGQAAINFDNRAGLFADAIDRRVYDLSASSPLVGTQWAAALYYGSQSDNISQLAVRSEADQSLLSAVGRFRTPETAFPGTWVLGGQRLLLGAVLGQQLFMQVRVWDITHFESFDAARAGGGVTGQSAAFTYLVPTSIPAVPSELLMSNFRSFGVFTVPEPSMLALFGAAGLGWMMIRRGNR